MITTPSHHGALLARQAANPAHSAGAIELIPQWYEALYGSLPGYLPIVTLPGASARFFATDRLDEAAAFTRERALHTNVFAGCCTLARVPSRGRGGAADALALPGFWSDIDVAGGHHRRHRLSTSALPLPPALADALDFLDALDLPATAILNSGGGLQAWWQFSEPLVFTTDAERVKAARLSSAFGATLVELGRRRGWHVDNVSDLARILRPPGTVNRKREPVPVVLLSYHSERQYTPAEIESILIGQVPAVRQPSQSLRQARDGQETPAEAFSRIVSWSDVLGPAGFMLMHEVQGAGHWHHPASTTGPSSLSATTDANNVPVLVVFSESAALATGLPAGPGHRLTKFRVWSLLHFVGDEAAAARALRRMGRKTT